MSESSVAVNAKVSEVLAGLGLVYAEDDQGRSWGLTRQTPGFSLDGLRPGQPVRLQLQQFRNASLVRRCDLLDTTAD